METGNFVPDGQIAGPLVRGKPYVVDLGTSDWPR